MIKTLPPSAFVSTLQHKQSSVQELPMISHYMTCPRRNLRQYPEQFGSQSAIEPCRLCNWHRHQNNSRQQQQQQQQQSPRFPRSVMHKISHQAAIAKFCHIAQQQCGSQCHFSNFSEDENVHACSSFKLKLLSQQAYNTLCGSFSLPTNQKRYSPSPAREQLLSEESLKVH
jgi:hypothetical protein